MKINVTCPTCDAEFWKEVREKHPSGGMIRGISAPETAAFDLVERKFYEGSCSKGHEIKFMLPQQRFEILFDIGACAIHDGYTREGVLSAVASLERFYEFWVRVVLRSKGLADTEIKKVWNMMSRQSERQIGAFASLYAGEFGRAPNVMENDRTSFRNDVAHKGRIPTRAEAIDFGDYIVGLIRPLAAELHGRYASSVRATILAAQAAAEPANLSPQEYLRVEIGTLLKAEPNEDAQSMRPLEQQLSDIHGRWSEWGKRKS